MRPKTATFGCRKFVEYSNEHWKILEKKRNIAREVMRNLSLAGLPCIVYGSVARGDVSEKSDIDIFVPCLVPSYRIELAVDWIDRWIVQATPNYVIKGELVVDEEVTVSFPLVKMKDREIDFYRFGGCLTLKQLENKERVAGVDKRLVLIVPRKNGHEEIPVNEMQPNELAKTLGVCIDIVVERIRVLERRREIGRTGTFLQCRVPPDESFESTLLKISKKNPAVRKLVDSR
jgi:predicted nucleotidyltransferase